MNPGKKPRKSKGEYRVLIMSCFVIWGDPKSGRDPVIGYNDVLVPCFHSCLSYHPLSHTQKPK